MLEETSSLKTNEKQVPSISDYISLNKPNSISNKTITNNQNQNKKKNSHKKEEVEDPSLDIEKKETDPYLIKFKKENIITEYNSTIKYFIKCTIFTLIESLIILIKSIFIFKIIKNSENVLCLLIFSSLSISFCILFYATIFQESLRHQMRYVINRLIGLFLSSTALVLFGFEIFNIIFVFSKMSELKKKCELNEEKKCQDQWLFNIIIGCSGFSFVGLLILLKFIVSNLINCFLILMGCKKDFVQRELEIEKPTYRTAKIDIGDFDFIK